MCRFRLTMSLTMDFNPTMVLVLDFVHVTETLVDYLETFLRSFYNTPDLFTTRSTIVFTLSSLFCRYLYTFT